MFNIPLPSKEWRSLGVSKKKTSGKDFGSLRLRMNKGWKSFKANFIKNQWAIYQSLLRTFWECQEFSKGTIR